MDRNVFLPAALAIGVALGAAGGLAIDNLWLGLGLGVAVGVGVGLGLRDRPKTRPTPPEPDKSKVDDNYGEGAAMTAAAMRLDEPRPTRLDDIMDADGPED